MWPNATTFERAQISHSMPEAVKVLYGQRSQYLISHVLLRLLLLHAAAATSDLSAAATVATAAVAAALDAAAADAVMTTILTRIYRLAII